MSYNPFIVINYTPQQPSNIEFLLQLLLKYCSQTNTPVKNTPVQSNIIDLLAQQFLNTGDVKPQSHNLESLLQQLLTPDIKPSKPSKPDITSDQSKVIESLIEQLLKPSKDLTNSSPIIKTTIDSTILKPVKSTCEQKNTDDYTNDIIKILSKKVINYITKTILEESPESSQDDNNSLDNENNINDIIQDYRNNNCVTGKPVLKNNCNVEISSNPVQNKNDSTVIDNNDEKKGFIELVNGFCDLAENVNKTSRKKDENVENFTKLMRDILKEDDKNTTDDNILDEIMKETL